MRVQEWHSFCVRGFTRILSYGDFYDVPRLFIVTVTDGLLVFDAPFDDSLDDYAPEYTVHFLPWSEAKRLHGDWTELTKGAELRGKIPVADVDFDPTHRLLVSEEVVARFGG